MPMQDREVSVAEFFRIVRQRWLWIAGITVLMLILALLWSLIQTPRYRASAQVLVDTESAAEIFDPVTGSVRDTRAMTNESVFARSRQVREAAQAAMINADHETAANASVSANESSSADVLVFTAVALSGPDAALAAQTHAATYITLRRDRAVQEYLETAQIVEENLREVQAELDAVDDDDRLQRSVLEARVLSLGQALSDLNVSAELGGSSATIVEDAQAPLSPFRPQTVRNSLLGLIGGLIIGLGAAIIIDALDTSITSKEAVEAAVKGVPTLAIVPTVKDWRERASTKIVTAERPKSREAEAYRTLVAALEFALLDSNAKIIQVTSANPGEGKTTTAVNMALTLARKGMKVAMLDGDLRKPRIHAFFDIPLEPGFTNVLLGHVEIQHVLREVDRGAGVLSVVTTGPLPPGPSEMLGSKRTGHTLKQLADLCDMLIVDSAPVLPVSDALVLAKKVDATVLIANGSRTSLPELKMAAELLSQVDAPLVGTVLNEVRRSTSGYGYGYGYGYGEEDDDGR